MKEPLVEETQQPHLALDRQLTVGDHQYLITASGGGARRIDLAVVGCDREGRVVSEISGGISPDDLPAVAEVLTSTLASLVALRPPGPAPVLRRRPPNQGLAWTADDDERLIERHRQGATEKQLMEELGRSRGGIRARLERLGEIKPTETAA
jgi:hypothetical protein